MTRYRLSYARTITMSRYEVNNNMYFGNEDSVAWRTLSRYLLISQASDAVR
jgi:hypothetical protein